MEFSTPIYDQLTFLGIGGLALFMTLICIIAYSVHKWQHLLLIGAWIALTGFLAQSGILSRFDITPPPFVLVIPALIIVAFSVGLSSFAKEISIKKSFAILVGLQAFRFPLELIMHHAYEVGIMPQFLSYSGYNFDVLTGIGAMILGIMFWRGYSVSHFAIWIWNIWGIFCLLVIAGIAAAGSPIFQAFGSEPEQINSWVVFFPYIWLPSVLVVIAIIGHILVTRKLLSKMR